MWIIAALALALAAAGAAHPGAQAEPPVHHDAVRFVQYLDEGTALEEVRAGRLDMYYQPVPADILEGGGVQVFSTDGGSYSILLNPAPGPGPNPFSEREARYALNFLIDRKLVVNELMGGLGSPSTSYYGASDPEYLTVLGELEGLGISHDPARAGAMLRGVMEGMGAELRDGTWHHGGEPVVLRAFIRSDDPVRRSMGEVLAAGLEGAGFAVEREFGDLNKAFVVVYGSDPSAHGWHLYTEGWGRSALSRYDPVGLSQMYAPWFSNMPGFNNPAYWNYENSTIDDLTRRIYSSGFSSGAERDAIVREAAAAGVAEAVRIFIATRTVQYAAGHHVDGIVNDLGAGMPGRFTAINAQGGGDQLDIGVKQIYQGAWNPVAGLTDAYGRHIWGVASDPATHRHPFTGQVIPVRAEWEVETAGPDGVIGVPPDAILWDPVAGAWAGADPGASSSSKVTISYRFGDWHHGEPISMDDVLYSAYFVSQWGSGEGRTSDPEYTPRAAQAHEALRGIRVVGADTLEVYVDYWHFDHGEIAERAALWPSVPWEVSAAMEQMVLDGRAAYSRSEATGKGTGWLSLLVPADASELAGYISGFAESGHVPAALAGADPDRVASRYGAALGWIAERGHAAISSGPYYVESYSPESRSITLRAFGGDYPFGAGRWSEFGSPVPPRITSASVPESVVAGSPLDVPVMTEGADAISYFVSGASGAPVSGRVDGGSATVSIPGEATAAMGPGAGSVRLFATSESVLRPDRYEAGFIVTSSGGVSSAGAGAAPGGDDPGYQWQAAAAAAAAAAALLAARTLARRARRRPRPGPSSTPQGGPR